MPLQLPILQISACLLIGTYLGPAVYDLVNYGLTSFLGGEKISSEVLTKTIISEALTPSIENLEAKVEESSVEDVKLQENEVNPRPWDTWLYRSCVVAGIGVTFAIVSTIFK